MNIKYYIKLNEYIKVYFYINYVLIFLEIIYVEWVVKKY